MTAWKHGDHPPALPRNREHHSVGEARDQVIAAARHLVGAPITAKVQREAREALRQALYQYDRKRDG